MASARALAPVDNGGGPHHVVAESGREAVDRARELLSPERARIEQRELARARGPEARCRETDEADRLIEGLAVEERLRAPVELQAVFRRLRADGTRDRVEVAEAQLQGQTRRRHAVRAELARHPLRLRAQHAREARGIAAIALERLLGPDGLRRR